MSPEEAEKRITAIYREAAKARPGVTLDSSEGPLGRLWAIVDEWYAR